MLRWLLAVLCLCAIASAKVPRKLSTTVIETPDRKNIDLKKYHGKVVMLVMFLTDCADCQSMVTFASKLETELGAKGFQVIGAAVDDKAPYLVTGYIQRYRPTFPVGFLRKDPLIKILDLAPGVVPVAPLIMFIDHTGTVRFQYSGKDKAVFGENNKTLRLIALNLIRQHDENQAPQTVTAPAK
jgi:thiol-disulfide isomerase/thioredoxin